MLRKPLCGPRLSVDLNESASLSCSSRVFGNGSIEKPGIEPALAGARHRNGMTSFSSIATAAALVVSQCFFFFCGPLCPPFVALDCLLQPRFRRRLHKRAPGASFYSRVTLGRKHNPRPQDAPSSAAAFFGPDGHCNHTVGLLPFPHGENPREAACKPLAFGWLWRPDFQRTCPSGAWVRAILPRSLKMPRPKSDRGCLYGSNFSAGRLRSGWCWPISPSRRQLWCRRRTEAIH